MKKFIPGCVIIIIVLPLLICGLNTAIFSTMAAQNQNKWNETKPDNYSLTVNYGSWESHFTTFQESVFGGTVTVLREPSFYNIEANESTIDRLFAQIHKLATNPMQLWGHVVEYDPTYGYPVRFGVNDWDLGELTEITNFTPLS